jgi:hypothetical protein
MEISKLCRNKNVSINVDTSKKYVRGKTWSFANDKAGTKFEITGLGNGELTQRKIEPKAGGIVYSSLQWMSDRPSEFKKKTVTVPLHHWIKCSSIPNKQIKEGDYSFYHRTCL